MAYLNNLSIDWDTSPRIITVGAPATVITIQDLYDTLMIMESENRNTAFNTLISAAGKNALGGGIYVGITATLLNAVLAFESRPGPAYIQCSVTGGNILALDINGVEIPAIFPTAFTQVIISLSASATLQQLPEIQYSSFQNAVTIDAINGSSGTPYPIGSTVTPSISLDFANIIAMSRGFKAFKFINDYSVDSLDGDLNGYTFIGEASIRPTLTITQSNLISNGFFQTIKLTGYLNGLVSALHCSIFNVISASGMYEDCEMGGSLSIGSTPLQLVECYASDTAPLVIDCSAGGQITLNNWSGDVLFRNTQVGQQLLINSNGGTITFDSTCGASTARLTGLAKYVNHSSTLTVVNEVSSGGSLTDQDKTDIAVKVWNQPTTATYNTDSFGEFFKSWISNKLLSVAKFLALK